MPKAFRPDTRAQLLRGNFTPAGPQSSAVSDPLEPTPMELTLDQLKPYELNPRHQQNPRYEELKASIRARGLDDTPAVSRRPGEALFIIHNGGNTRLQILNDLWKETRDERFFRIRCLFQPWAGEIRALTGHMAENDLRGNLLWVERCLAVNKTRELYEQQENQPISQAELARRLSAEGYPVSRTHINKMDQTLQLLFPCIPNILWDGMGVDAAQKLLSLRALTEAAWNKLLKEKGSPPHAKPFAQVFADALAHFDAEPRSYVLQHAQDELVGMMTEELRPNGVSYELILLEMDCLKAPAAPQPDAINTAPPAAPPILSIPLDTPHTPANPQQPEPASVPDSQPSASMPAEQPAAPPPAASPPEDPAPQPPEPICYADTESLPVMSGDGTKVHDIWQIYPQHLYPDVMRHQIDLLAMELTEWADLAECQGSTRALEEGIGYRMTRPKRFRDASAEAIWTLLATLTGNCEAPIAPELLELALTRALPDDLLIKLFRLIRLVRALHAIVEEVPHE